MTYTRKKAIEWLIEDDINDLIKSFNNNDFHYIKDVLHDGFDGYENYKNYELENEIRERKDNDSIFVK